MHIRAKCSLLRQKLKGTWLIVTRHRSSWRSYSRHQAIARPQMRSLAGHIVADLNDFGELSHESASERRVAAIILL